MIPNQKVKWTYFENRTQSKIIVDWTDTYICEAEIGTPETTSKWAISKIDTDWNTTYPLNNEWYPVFAMIFLPSEATTLTYSYEKV